MPGTFSFSTLDNGVTSNESWRIVDAVDDLSWSLFYYAGAASVVGQTYRGGEMHQLPSACFCASSPLPPLHQLTCCNCVWVMQVLYWSRQMPAGLLMTSRTACVPPWSVAGSRSGNFLG